MEQVYRRSVLFKNQIKDYVNLKVNGLLTFLSFFIFHLLIYILLRTEYSNSKDRLIGVYVLLYQPLPFWD